MTDDQNIKTEQDEQLEPLAPEPEVANELTEKDKDARLHALVSYGLMLVGCFTGFFYLIGGIYAMIKKGDAQETIFESHHSNMVRVFWWSILWTTIGLLSFVIFVGWFVLVANLIWVAIRLIKGVTSAYANKPYPA